MVSSAENLFCFGLYAFDMNAHKVPEGIILVWGGDMTAVSVPLGHHNSNDSLSFRPLWLMILLIRAYDKGRLTQRHCLIYQFFGMATSSLSFELASY